MAIPWCRCAPIAGLSLPAIGLTGWRTLARLVHPWAGDAQVHAKVIQISPRVSASVIELPISDGQAVNTGDLLFRIDPRTF